MSADNGIYILQSLDGYRVIEAGAIENLHWWNSCCKKPNIQEDVLVSIDDNLFHDKCINCGTLDPESEERDELNPKMLLQYFGKCTVYDTEKEVLEEATNIFEEIMDDNIGIVEYGISFIRGWKDKFFPNIKENNNG